VPLETEQVAQLNSKDMSLPAWLALAAAVRRHMGRPAVGGLVVTHRARTRCSRRRTSPSPAGTGQAGGAEGGDAAGHVVDGRWPPAAPLAHRCHRRRATGAQATVIAGNGNGNGSGSGSGSIHQLLPDAARRASIRGVLMVGASRCPLGSVFGVPASALPSYGALSPGQARIELMLDLLGRRVAASSSRRRAGQLTSAA
jgi:L-asparaginase/Glu-tRNA(Gln) amidotransferase subunit D